MYKASLQKHTLEFKNPSGTSRGVLNDKDSWFIKIYDERAPEIQGTGEASIIRGLSPDWSDDYETILENIVQNVDSIITNNLQELIKFPSIYFAVETALLDLKNGGNAILFPSPFTENENSININGLIWMGSKDFMEQQIKTKLKDGFRCLKMKIGAIDFEKEIEIIKDLRNSFPPEVLELRVDANGAFTPQDVMGKLDFLANYHIHSIEQPIKQGQYDEMKSVCANSPIPVALDEELIGLNSPVQKDHLLDYIEPQYIILKPSLIGGFKGTDEWINAAEKINIKWWITSALESNIGLNAIAQYTSVKNNSLPQGLGTGQLFTNNMDSNLYIEKGKLFHQKVKKVDR